MSDTTRIIFLDMDGVISTHRAWFAQAGRKLPDRWMDAEAMGHLNALCKRSGASVVVSSTWRLNRTVGEFRAILTRNGFEGVLHRDWRTNRLRRRQRGDEVLEWMTRHQEVTGHVILDDENDFYAHQPLVLTEFIVGLGAEHVERALALLGTVDA